MTFLVLSRVIFVMIVFPLFSHISSSSLCLTKMHTMDSLSVLHETWNWMGKEEKKENLKQTYMIF